MSVVAATPLVNAAFSVAFTEEAQTKSFDASMLPVFWIVIWATPPKTPGATFVSVRAALHAGLTLLIAPLARAGPWLRGWMLVAHRQGARRDRLPRVRCLGAEGPQVHFTSEVVTAQ